MTIFTQIKESVTVPQAAERYGLVMNRSRMCRCPFHADRSPSMKLNDSYFYCFGCQESGDVIALCAKLFDLSPMEAARRLADDFGIRIDEDPRPNRKPPGKGRRTAEPPENPRKREGHCLYVLIEYERFLKAWIERYAPKSPEAEWDERFCAANRRLPQVSQTIDDLFSPDAELRAQTAARLTNDGTIARIEQFLKEAGKSPEQPRCDDPQAGTESAAQRQGTGPQSGSTQAYHKTAVALQSSMPQDDMPQSSSTQADRESSPRPQDDDGHPVTPHFTEQDGKEVSAHGDDRNGSDRPAAA